MNGWRAGHGIYLAEVRSVLEVGAVYDLGRLVGWLFLGKRRHHLDFVCDIKSIGDIGFKHKMNAGDLHQLASAADRPHISVKGKRYFFRHNIAIQCRQVESVKRYTVSQPSTAREFINYLELKGEADVAALQLLSRHAPVCQRASQRKLWTVKVGNAANVDVTELLAVNSQLCLSDIYGVTARQYQR